MRRSLLLAVALTLAGGCASDPIRGITNTVEDLFKKGERQVSGESEPAPARRDFGQSALRAGLRQYDDGQYPEAAGSLQKALDRGLSKPDQVTAHKTLAFIHCAAGRTGPCRDEFRRALRVDPNMELDAAEAGHPGWGPVFRSVKAER